MRKLYRVNKDTGQLEQLYERQGPPRPGIAPAIHCDDIIGGEYRDTTGRKYYSKKAMIRDLEANGSYVMAPSEALNRPQRKVEDFSRGVDAWEKDVTETYYAMRDGMVPPLPAKEKAILGDD